MKKYLLSLLLLLCFVTSLADTWSYTTASKTLSQVATNKDKELNGKVWSISGYFNQYDGTKKCWSFGTNNNKANTVTLSSSDFSDVTITSISIQAAGNGTSKNAFSTGTVTAKVGDTNFSCSDNNVTTTATEYKFTGSAQGDIEIKLNSTSGTGFLVYNFSVEYTEREVKQDPQLQWHAYLDEENNDVTITELNLETGQEIHPWLVSAANPSYTFEYTIASSNPDVVAVLDNTTIKGVSAGSATVTAHFAGIDKYLAQDVPLTVNVTGQPQVAAPVFNPVSGTAMLVGDNVTISSATEGAQLYIGVTYTDKEGKKATSDALKDSPVTLTLKEGTYEFEVFAVKDDMKDSEVVSATYTAKPDVPADPVFTPGEDAADSFAEGTKVTVYSKGATSLTYTIEYDGDAEDVMDEVAGDTHEFTLIYDSVITVEASNDNGSSNNVSAAYFITRPDAPVYSVASGDYEEGCKVTITAAQGCKLEYTIMDFDDNTIEGVADDGTYTFILNKDCLVTATSVLPLSGYKSTSADAEYTVFAKQQAGAPVWSVANGQSVNPGTTVSVYSERADRLVIRTYDITGEATVETVSGNTAAFTVDAMHRRFSAIGQRDDTPDTDPVEVFYNITKTTAGDKYTLITSADQLFDGMEFVLVGNHTWIPTKATTSTTKTCIMGLNGNKNMTNRQGENIEIDGDVITSLPTDAGYYILTLEAQEANKWAIKATKHNVDNTEEVEGYFYAANTSNGSNNYLKTQEKPVAATFTVDTENPRRFEIAFDGDVNGYNKLQFNYSNTPKPLFSCYTGTGSNVNCEIYAKVATSDVSSDYSLSFKHIKYNKANVAKAFAATDATSTEFAASEPDEDGVITYTTEEVKDLCGQFTIELQDGTVLAGHADDPNVKTDFTDRHKDEICKDNTHAAYLVVRNHETVKLAIATHEKAVPMSTNEDDYHSHLYLHQTPKVSVALKPFYSANLTVDSDTVTGVDNIVIDNDNNSNAVLYNLQGIRVLEANPAPGLYIRRQGNTAVKVIIR